MPALRNDVLWFGPVYDQQIKGATAPGASPCIVQCRGDGFLTCAAMATGWVDEAGRRLPKLLAKQKIPLTPDGRLYLGAFSAGGQCVKRIALDAEDRRAIAGILLSDATYSTEWEDQKRGLVKPIEGLLRYALDCLADGRLFLATASSWPNKDHPTGSQTLDGLRRGIEAAGKELFDDALGDPLWAGLEPPVKAWRRKNVIFADFGFVYPHAEHATKLAPMLWPRLLAPPAKASPEPPADGPIDALGSACEPALPTTFKDDDASLIRHLTEARKYEALIRASADQFGLLPAVVAAIGSRESGWGLGLRPTGPTGTGDFGCRGPRPPARPAALPPDGAGFGRGLMQIDWDAHVFARTGDWRSPAENIGYGCKVLRDCIDCIAKQTGLRGLDLLRAALAGYNAGAGRVIRVVQSINAASVDSVTTGKNYARDVMNRAGWFQAHGFRSR